VDNSYPVSRHIDPYLAELPEQTVMPWCQRDKEQVTVAANPEVYVRCVWCGRRPHHRNRGYQ
jgi:hypothetical protein